MSDDQTNPISKRRWWTIGKWLLCLVVVAFVGRRAVELWQRDAVDLEVQPLWLALAGVVYVIGWLPSVWFWREAMRRLGGDVSPLAAARAYYCGHLGKYIPGKAMVLVIRGTMVATRGAPMRVGMLTAAYETLVMMGAGLAFGVAMSPLLFADASLPDWLSWLRWVIERPVLGPICVCIAGVAALPIGGKLLEKIGRKFVPKSEVGSAKDSQSKSKIDSSFLLLGTAVFVIGWMIHGFSLGLTLRSVTPGNFDWSNWLVWSGAAAFATSVGFIAIFAPGGIGVREWLIAETLAVQVGIEPGHAVAAAALLRVVWLATEVAISLVLLRWGRASLTTLTGNTVKPSMSDPTCDN